MTLKSYLILFMAALIAGLVAGLIWTVAWEVLILGMLSTLIGAGLFYIWARGLMIGSLTMFCVFLGFYLASTL